MKSQKRFLVAMILLLTFMVLSFSSVKAADQTVWTFHENGISFQMFSPYLAYPGDKILLTTFVAIDSDSQNLTITLKVQLTSPWHQNLTRWNYSASTYQVWKYSAYIYSNFVFTKPNATKLQLIPIPTNVSPGAVFCNATCTWTIYRQGALQNWSKVSDSFPLVYLKNKEYDDYVKTHSHTDTEWNVFQTGHLYSNDDYHTARLVLSISAFVGTTIILFAMKKWPRVRVE